MTPDLPGLLRRLPVAAVAAYPVLAGHDALRRAVFVSVVVMCVGSAGAGFALNRPLLPRVWALLLGGQLLLGAGDLAAAVDRAVGGPAAPAVGGPVSADLLRLLAFGLLSVGLLRLAGGGDPTREGGALLDATLVATAATTVAGVFLILPATADAGSEGVRWAAGVGCPVAAGFALVALTRLVTTRGAPTPAFRLLTASVVVTVVASTGSMGAARAGVTDVPVAVGLEVLALSGHVLFALAALHPTVATLSAAARTGSERLTAARLAALGGAMLLTPATLAAQSVTGGARHLPLVAVGSTGVIVLVLVRVRGLLRQVEDQAAELSRLARADALTGLPNRRSWDFELARAAGRAREGGERLVVALLDLDHFKAFNDTHGHQAGDELLQTAAAAWREQLGRAGVLARYGGEEFALAVLGRTLEEVAGLLGRFAAVTPLGQTFSAGVADWDFLSDPQEAVSRADAALYAAKDAGRDRIVTAPAIPHAPPAPASVRNRPNG